MNDSVRPGAPPLVENGGQADKADDAGPPSRGT